MVQTQTERTPEVGDQAPDFTLLDTEQKPVSLHDFRGETVVLAFFPAAFSGTCTKEMCAFRDSLAQFNHANAQVLGISVDLPFTLRKFKEANGLDFPLLSDFDHKVIEEYGVVNNNFLGFSGGVAKRAVFVVDGTGKVAWEWVSAEPGMEPDYAKVLQVTEDLKKSR